jgi:hypothetical protein
MTFYFVASDTELDGSLDQTVSGSYCGECKWFILSSDADLSAYEFDAYESYLEDDSFQDLLIAEFATDPSPFTLGSLQKLHLGVVDDSGNIIWQCKASELPPESIIKRSLEPEDIDWDIVPGGRPESGFLIRFTGFEEDGPELPLHEFDDDPGSAEQVKVIFSDKLDGMSADEVCGLIWKGKTIDIYGTGGAGYSPEYDFYQITADVIEEKDV